MPIEASADPFAAVGAIFQPMPGAAPSAGAAASAAPETFNNFGRTYRLVPGTTGVLPEDKPYFLKGVMTPWQQAGHPPPPIAAGGTAETPPNFTTPAGPAGTPPTLSPGVAATKSAATDPFAAVGAIFETPSATEAPSAATPTPPAATPAPGAPRGMLANIGAGTGEAVAGLLGMPVDLVTNIINLGSRGINAATGAQIPQITEPVGGSASIEKGFGLIGANPQNVQPATPGEALARPIARGVTSVMLPGGVARRLVEAGATAPALSTLAAGGGTAGGVAGGAGGATGYAAAQAVPDEWKPIADMLGNIVGGGIVAGAAAPLTAAGRVGMDAAKRAVQAMPIVSGRQVSVPGSAMTATPGQQAVAGATLAQRMGMTPADAAATIPSAESPLVAGSQPTVGQATGNLGALNLERELRTGHREPFTAAEGQNAQARVAALRGLAGPQAAGEAAANFFAEQLRRLRGMADALDQAEAAQGRTIAEHLGPGTADTSEQELGAAHRAALEALRRPVKEAVQQLYAAIDPEGKLALDVTTVREAARAILKEVEPRLGVSLDPSEAAVVHGAANLRDVELFSDVRKLDSALGEAQRAIRNDPKLGAESQPFRRITALRAAIDQAMSEASGEEAAQEAGAAQTGVHDAPTTGERLAAVAETVPSAGNTVTTPSGRQIGVRYRVADADSLIASHDTDLKPNPAYPAELQPRERGRAASQAQVQRIAGNLNPDLLGVSPTADTGAPIIGPDGVVESGNARVLGVRRALAEGGDAAARYRDWLKAQGYDTTGMANPILVRERTTALSPEDRVRFTEEANAPTGLAMSATEQAAVDARRLTDAALGEFRGGDITLQRNGSFIRAFMRDVTERGQEGALVTGEGELSAAGAQRVRNALVQRAYGDRNLTAALAETGDEDIRAFGGALTDAAGDMARLQSEIDAGRVSQDFTYGRQLAEAAQVIRGARERNISIADAVAQQDAFNPISKEVEDVLQAAYGKDLKGRFSRGRFAEYLRAYAKVVSDETAAGGRLLGEPLTAAEARGAAAQGRAGATSAGVSAGGPSLGVRAGTGGTEPVGPGTGAAGPGAAAGPENAAAEPAQGSGRGLEPNFTAEDRAQLRQANALYREYKDTFRRGAVGKVLSSQVGPTGFRMAEADIPAALFTKGPKGATAADDLIRAAGSPEAAVAALGDYPAFAFRRAAAKDGVIDPKAAAKWIEDMRPALDKLPGLREKFADAAAATRTLEEASARGRALIDAYQKDAAGTFLTKEGLPADPQKGIEALLRSKTPGADARRLVDLARGDEGALDGLRSALADYMVNRLSSTREAGVGGAEEIAGAAYQRFVRDPRNQEVMRAVLGYDGTQAALNIAEDIQRAARSINKTNIPGSPATFADKVAHAAHEHGLSVVSQIILSDVMVRGIESALEGGLGGGSVVATAGGALGLLAAGLRQAGMRRVEDLLREAVLNPEVARALLMKAPELTERTPALRVLVSRLGLIGAGAAAGR